jgi:predicted RNase H-like HicB family nuclease
MEQSDYQKISLKEFHKYVLAHREDDAAFYAYVDRLHAEGNWTEMPALKSPQDLDNYPELIDLIRESAKNLGKSTMKSRSFTVVVYREDDVYIAECPEVGTVDQGETIEQAIAGLTAATKLYLEEFPVPETSPRFVTSIEVSYA